MFYESYFSSALAGDSAWPCASYGRRVGRFVYFHRVNQAKDEDQQEKEDSVSGCSF